jgi:uncharacterized protein with HEPN domain
VNSADRRRLLHVVDYIDRIDAYCAGGRPAFDDDPRTQDAVLYGLTVIGEALGALTPESYQLLGSLPPHLPKDQRNILVHQYWRVDPDIVWATVTQDLSPLRADIERALEISPRPKRKSTT